MDKTIVFIRLLTMNVKIQLRMRMPESAYCTTNIWHTDAVNEDMKQSRKGRTITKESGCPMQN